MSDQSLLSVVCAIQRYFPQATEGDCEAIWKDTKKHPIRHLDAALELHRRQAGRYANRPDLERVRVLTAASATASRPLRQACRIVDHLRREKPSPLANFEYLAQHYAACWASMKSTVTSPKVQEIGRNMILKDAVKALGQIGFKLDEAIAQARGFVGLSPTDPLPANAGTLLQEMPVAQDKDEAIRNLLSVDSKNSDSVVNTSQTEPTR